MQKGGEKLEFLILFRFLFIYILLFSHWLGHTHTQGRKSRKEKIRKDGVCVCVISHATFTRKRLLYTNLTVVVV